ncbi:dipeptide ABC transporter ATP-binding protein [Acidisphaera sp. L21]|uniref:dipeptide ABC transporter ATP-binding protein n=1 Tax=Acidisphaera sp. L21 TaxID=1641851 RepID=UPI00131B26C1|nr:dipeptide ABC transporter ATP-binding protein [Acidisphaera sp. L21]
MSVLAADNVTRHYKIGGRHVLKAVDGVSFELLAGRTLAVVGESGCGKSTLARLCALMEPPTAGAISIAGKPTAANQSLQLQNQMVFQNPYGSLNPRRTIGAILVEPLTINNRGSKPERIAAARRMLDRVGLRPEAFDRYPHMFSGGQRQRVAIARALMLSPAVVTADEPVSALDVSVQAQVLNLMRDLQDELGIAYLFISHDISVVRHMAQDVLVMYCGRPAEQGLRGEVLDRPLHPYTRMLLSSTPFVDPARRRMTMPVRGELPSPIDPPPGCAFNTRCPYAADRCTVERPALRSVESRLVACHFAEKIATEAPI